MSHERRTLEEIVARYELEPDLRDVYVEGEFDAFLIRWLLDEAGISSVFVYEIATVNIPSELVSEAQAENNNRGRVIALAQKLDKALGTQARQATLIIDRDFDSLLDRSLETDFLLVTDYSCMEMYLFNEWHIKKFFTLVLQEPNIIVRDTIRHMVSVLQDLYLVRFYNSVNSLGLESMSFIRCCELDSSGEIHFDREEFLVRYLNKNGAINLKEKILRETESYRARLSSDYRMNANAHDFFELMEWLSRKMKPRCFKNSEAFCRAFAGCFEASRVQTEPLFNKLLQRTAS
jgi:hypothetical protein